MSGGAHNTHLNAGVSILGELSGEELVELGLENSVGDKLPLLRHLGRHVGLCNVEVLLKGCDGITKLQSFLSKYNQAS